MDAFTRSRPNAGGLFSSAHVVLRLGAAIFMLTGLLAGYFLAGNTSAQPLPGPTEMAAANAIEIRVHSCPDDLDATGFFQYLTQCTSERGLYGVALGLESGGIGAPQFQYSQPDGTGRAALMRWTSYRPENVTITEVAPDPIRPSVAFCSLQPFGSVPLTMDGEEVPLNDGVMSIELEYGDTLMCDWYRFPGGVTAGDEEGDGDDQGGGGDDDGDDDNGGAGNGNEDARGVVFDPETGEADEELTGSQIFVRAWQCASDVQRPEVLDTDYAQGLAELKDACTPSEDTYPFTLEGGEGPVDDGEIAGDDEDEDADNAGDDGDFQGIVAEDGTVVDEEGGADEAVAGGPSGEGEGVDQGIVGDDEGENGGDEAAGDPGTDDGGEGGAGVYPPIQVGGDTYRGWNGLAAGGYTILETVPEGYDQLVLCDGILAGTEAGANTFELLAVDGAVTYDLSEGELLLCDWFNRSGQGDGGDGDGDANAENNDRDRDGLLNTEEADYGTDPDDEDSDDDDVVDGDEILAGTDPNNPDTDGDTFTDAEEMYLLGTDPLVYDLGPLDDEDGDFLLNGEEVHEYGTDPFISDSDEDLVSDYREVVTYGSDPNNPDSDGDGRDDGGEVDAGMDPTDPNS